jgi:predicted Zn-dependent protease
MNSMKMPGILPAVLLCLMLAGAWFPPALPGQSQGRGQSGGAPDQDLNDALSRMNQALEDEDLSAEDGYYIGRAVGAMILRSYPVYESPALTRYLNNICGALAVNSPRPEMYNGYHVVILNSREINAFATPGGHIFLTRELVELAGSEDTLAAVIAHELAHIQLEHGVRIINNMRLTRDLTETGTQAAGVAARAASINERKILFGNSVVELTNTLVKNGYSREQEFEADHYALALLALTGYQPSALVEMLRLLERSPRQSGGIFATHPAPSLRIRNVESLLGRYRIDDTRSARRRRFINK